MAEARPPSALAGWCVLPSGRVHAPYVAGRAERELTVLKGLVAAGVFGPQSPSYELKHLSGIPRKLRRAFTANPKSTRRGLRKRRE